jgi:hypothetical protein
LLIDEIGEDEDAVLEALKAEAEAVAEKQNGAKQAGSGDDLAAAAEGTDYYRRIAGAFMRSGGEPNDGGRR